MNPLEQRITHLEAALAALQKSDRYTVQRDIQIFDGRNIQLASGTGTKLGTAATQKLALFGATPVVQAAAISAPTTPGGTYSSTDAQSAVNAINSLRTALKNLGITA